MKNCKIKCKNIDYIFLTITFIYESAKKPDETKRMEDEQTLAQLSSTHHHSLTKCQLVQTSYTERIKFPLAPAWHMEVGCPGSQGLELLTPNPGSIIEHPTSLPYPQPSHEPRPPYPAQGMPKHGITQSQELCGNNYNSNNQY